ncbi:MAG: xanthine dehydrogenase family protein molybdopterin-binding subunit, partial [Alphaproteobacteria bacterium]|nr:xanthine dehydrogenase family protein molybdopterin-binding subunit [Alphaproteobacteria bacterium]
MNDNSQQFKWIGTSPIRPDGLDKVTGRALFGADLKLPGMLIGRILRSPHAHARIRGIDTSKAEALAGVKAVVTSADFPDQPSVYVGPDRVQSNLHHITRNVMAREKALYDGHAVAAVAATSASIADQALKLIEVDYEVLAHVTDVAAALAPDASLLHEDLITRGMDPAPEKPSNVAK